MMNGTPEQTSLEDVLPIGFLTIQQIQALPDETIKSGTLLSVMGFVRDQQAPRQTNGTDAKYTLEIVDHSIPDANYGFKFVIFRPMDKMPRLSGVGDVVLVRNAKVQMWSGEISMIFNHCTEIHLLERSKIPESMTDGKSLPWSSYPAGKNNAPKPSEIKYLIWAHTQKDQLDIPSETEFQEKTEQSRKRNDKFSLLQDVRTGNFYNLLGEVIKIYDSSSNSLTLYLSDYTANNNFFNQPWGGGDQSADIPRDEWGYIKSRPGTSKAGNWPGPYGKMSLQITVFDSHASFVREHVKLNKWVILNNVQIKFGKMGGCLEGYLRGDQRSSTKCQVAILDSTEDPDGINDLVKVRWKDALRHKRDWEKLFKEQTLALQKEAANLEKKRKQDEDEQPGRLNSKKKRQQQRAAAFEKGNAAERKISKLQLYNENVRCGYPDQKPTRLSKILEPRILRIEGAEHASQFSIEKYRANVRVIDYFPHRVEDFAFSREAKDYDMLSDYSGSEDTDLEDDMRYFRSGNGFKTKIWEWRFAMQIEDAEPGVSKDRLWLFVDNQAAQMLLGLDQNAGNLRRDSVLLSQLKNQLFKLWGDLEERKSSRLEKESQRKESPPLSFESDVCPASPSNNAGAMPALEGSDDEGEDFLENLGKTAAQPLISEDNERAQSNLSTKSESLPASNKPFTCCIKQYGVRLKEHDPLKSNAGENHRWQRAFALFGTEIL